MASTVHWLFEVSVNDGQLETFKALMKEMVAATKHEPNTLIYEWYFNEDQSICQINERYSDSAATVVHLQSFGGFAERFMAAVTPVNLIVMGDPDHDVREGLADLNPTYVLQADGFSR
jgi:quinol monooxygenase YgiN